MDKNNVTRDLALYGSIILTLILVGIALGTTEVEGKIWYVDDSGGSDFTTIQEAVDAATDSDEIMVSEGSYGEHVVLNKSIALIGESPENTVIDVNGTGSAIRIDSNGVNISGFMLTGGGKEMDDAGVLIVSQFNHLSQLNCSNNRRGIRVLGNGNNTFTKCEFVDNQIGIEIISNNNSISESTFMNNYYGTYISGIFNGPVVSNTTIFDNSLHWNGIGIQCSYSSHNDILMNNISENSNSGISLLSSSSSVIRKNSLASNTWNGIQMQSSQDLHITKNSLSDGRKGISIGVTHNVTIVDNQIEDNEIGIFLMGGSKDIEAHFNVISASSAFAVDASLNGGLGIDATNNWWGNDHGPYHHETNPNGKGGNITMLVDFDPWKGKERTVKYVDDDAPDGGNGTMDHPYNSVQDAVTNVENEGIVYVWDGMYNEGILIEKPLILIGNGSVTIASESHSMCSMPRNFF